MLGESEPVGAPSDADMVDAPEGTSSEGESSVADMLDEHVGSETVGASSDAGTIDGLVQPGAVEH